MIPGCISKSIFYNTEIINASLVNPPLASHVLYDVIRVEKGIPLFLEKHSDRFFKTFELANLPYPFQKSFLKRAVTDLINFLSLKIGNLRVVYYASDEPMFAIYQIAHIYPTREVYFKGVSSKMLRAERVNPNIKQELQVRQLANQFIQEKKIYDVCLVDSSNYVREGSKTNLFFIKENVLITPPEADVLSGITRQNVIELAPKLELEIVEKKISVLELENFDAAFFTGTSPKVLPIAYIDSFRFDVSHPILLKIMLGYDEKIRTYLQEYK